MNPNIFREFSIRGIADHDLSDAVVTSLGQAIGNFFEKHKVVTLVLGRDIRNSSLRIRNALVYGLQQTRIKVIDLGLVPTPVQNFATDYYEAGAGVMITASHNPADYNGLKIRTADRSLNGIEIQDIYRLALDQSIELADQSSTGILEEKDVLPIYIEKLKALATFQNKDLKIVIDGGNGANGPAATQLFRELGCQVTLLNEKLDGDFPGRGPDPTKGQALADLIDCVKQENADLGIAYDGDGDRLALVDDQGNRVLGDQIIMLLARDILKRGSAKIVYEILCTQALADDVIANGGEPIMTPSGYAFVHEIMQEVDGAIGGELSGHLFFDEPEFRFDDAILATVKLLNVVSSSNEPLSNMVAELPAYASSPQVRLACPDEFKIQVVNFVREHFEPDYTVETIDGARIHFPEGWATVRQSNTQPVISMRFEARTEEILAQIQDQVQTLVEAEIARLENG